MDNTPTTTPASPPKPDQPEDGATALAREVYQHRMRELEPLRQQIANTEASHSDTTVDIRRGKIEIDRLMAELDGWQRFVKLHERRAAALEMRIKADREILRAHEDYESASK